MKTRYVILIGVTCFIIGFCLDVLSRNRGRQVRSQALAQVDAQIAASCEQIGAAGDASTRLDVANNKERFLSAKLATLREGFWKSLNNGDLAEILACVRTEIRRRTVFNPNSDLADLAKDL